MYALLLSCVHLVIAGSEDNEDEELNADVKFSLSDEEAEIRSYLLHGDPLSEQTIEKFAGIFWNSEPYKYDELFCMLFLPPHTANNHYMYLKCIILH